MEFVIIQRTSKAIAFSIDSKDCFRVADKQYYVVNPTLTKKWKSLLRSF